MFSRPIPISRPIRTSYLSRSLSFYTFCLFLTLLSVLLLPLCTSARAFAATSPITITSESATTVFAKNINFQVSVSDSDSAITQATITITIKVPTYSQQTYDVSVNTPGQTLQLNWQDDISKSNFLFSGTPLMYSWMFHDKNDHWFTGTNQNVTVVDSRYQWQHLSQGELQVNWYGQGTDFGQIILSQALDNIKRISANLGGGPTRPITLWVYQSSEDFRGALPPDTFEWVGGLAYPPLDEAFVVVDSPNADTLVRDMPHELTHVIFHQLVPLTDLVPTWFDEGLAVYNQIYHEPEMKQRFDDALQTHSLLHFDSLASGFPADSDKAYLAYAQSWQFISYMYNTFGTAKIAHLIQAMNNLDGTFNNEMKSALGEDPAQIENQWLISLHQPAILAPTQPTPQPSHKTLVPVVTTTDATTPWLIGAGVLLILLALSSGTGLFVYQRRNTRLASQSVHTQPEQSTHSVQRIPTQSAHTSQSEISPTSDVFERYMPVEISHPEAPDDFRSYTEPSYYTPSYKPISQVEKTTDQTSQENHPSVQHDVSLSEEEFPSFTFGQEYKIEQASGQQEGTHYQTPQE